MITDPMGQWKHPGKNTRIPSDKITMKGVNYPVLGVSNNGQRKMMQPGQEYTFPGADYVDEFPQLKRGGKTRGLIPMPKPSKKGLASKKYSRSLEATNRLFTENKLFEKPKSRKNKVFDPNAKYYQDGGNKKSSNINIEPRIYAFDEGPGAQAIGADLNISHKSGVHGSLSTQLPFFNRQVMPRATQTIGINKKYKNVYGDVTGYNQSTPEKLINPSLSTEIGYNKNLGDRFNFNVGLKNTMHPGSYFNPSLSAGIKYGFQDGGNTEDYVELELDDKEIAQYVKGGYVVEDISVPSLTRAQGGGSPKSKWIAPVNMYGRSIVDPTTGLIYKDLPDVNIKAGKKGFGKRVKSFLQKDLGKLTKEAEELGKGVGYIAGIQGDIEPAVYNREGLNKFKSEFKRLKGDFKKEIKTAEKNRKEAADNKAEYDKWKKKLDDGEISASEFLLKGKGKGWEVYNDAKVARGTGPGADYSAKEAEANAMKNVPEFVDMVSNVATAIPLAGGAGALAGSLAPVANAAGKVIFNPVTQGILAAPAIAQMATHPIDTVTGIATTGVEAYDKLMGDEDDVNRFGNPYWQDIDHLVNTVALLPGIGSLKAAREFLKTRKGFKFAKNYIKPVKDAYKKGVKKYQKATAPFLNTNVPGVAAGTLDAIVGGRGATEVVNKAAQLFQDIPEWANPTIGNVLKGYGYMVAADTGIKGANNIQKGFSEGDKEKFDEGIAKTVDAVTTLSGATNSSELSNATTPLVMMTTANEIKDNIANNENTSALFNIARLVNQTAGLPTIRTQVAPTQLVKAFRRMKHAHIRRNLKQEGGVVSELSQKEIDDLVAQGYIIEELD